MTSTLSGAFDSVLVPSEALHPALPVKDDGHDVNACVFGQGLVLMLLAIHFNQRCEANGLGGCDRLLRRAEVGRGAAADLNRHKRVIDDADDIEFTHTVPQTVAVARGAEVASDVRTFKGKYGIAYDAFRRLTQDLIQLCEKKKR